MPYMQGYLLCSNKVSFMESGRISGGIPERPLPPKPPEEPGQFGYTQINVLDGLLNAAEIPAVCDILSANCILTLEDDLKFADVKALEQMRDIAETPAFAKDVPEAHSIPEQRPDSEDFERENSFAHWVLFTHGDWDFVGTASEDTPLPVSTSSSKAVTATPNTSNGYVLFRFLLDGSDVGAGSAGANSLIRVYTVSAGSSGQHKHLTLDFRVGYVIVADSSCTPTGYKAISSGSTQEYTAAIGAPPQGYRYQWIFDGQYVGSNSNKYTPPAQTDGTAHTISVMHVPL